MRNCRLQLVNAPLTAGYVRSTRTGSYPPLSIATLQAFIKQQSPHVEIELLDGEITQSRMICDKVNADVVGISCNIMTYDSALMIAEAAAAHGSRVILGGPFPTSMPERILKNRPFVDAIVVGDGELALNKYVSGEAVASIPNICFRQGDSIVRNSERVLDLEPLPFPDYKTLPLQEYFESYEARYSAFKPFRKSLAIYSRKGCIWRDASNGGCVFCMIPHKGVRYKSPKRLWEEIGFFNREYGVDFFWEVCDTFTENSRWIDEFVTCRPSDLDVAFHVYGRACNISPKMARQLKTLGVYEVFIGAESGDDEILELMNKGIKVDQTRRAVELLANEGISVIVSFVLGLPGESSRTLQKTMDFASELYRYGNIVETSTSILLPIPGSNAFEMLMKVPGMKGKHSSDLLDLEELKSDWIHNFTHTNHDELQAALNSTLEVFPLNETFSQRELLSAPQC
ncbi:MAG TPA: radical SAM protein [Pyrinomonadaceae bacterium]|nr:radical SAM protein [Pyrinomonadaceae bacterium]